MCDCELTVTVHNNRGLSGGRYSLIYKPYSYVLPQRVGFLHCFGLKTGIDFACFGLESGIIFLRTTGSECISKSIVSVSNE